MIKYMICQAHSHERCTVARCVVLAQCAAQIPGAWATPGLMRSSWLHEHGYNVHPSRYIAAEHRPEPYEDHLQHDFAQIICARLIAWARWPGPWPCECSTKPRTSTICTRCILASYDHPLDKMFGNANDRRRLIRGDRGVNWRTLFVLCDYLADTGLWSEVHRWLPSA